MIPRALLLCLTLASWALPQTVSKELPPGVLLLSRVKTRVQQQFAHMPQYTCLETLERFYKASDPKAVEKKLDSVRLEVLFAERREFFDSPGGHDFRESDPGKFVAGGMIGSGMFASHLQNIFVSDNGLFEYRGEEDLNGRRTARWDYHVPLSRSAYVIGVQGAHATVASKGVFWADPLTYDLIRIEIHADQMPDILQTSEVLTTVDYARTRIGDDEVLLAQRGTLLMVREFGERSFDRFEFTHCRAYQAESTISFADPDAKSATLGTDAASRKPTSGVSAAPIPAGLAVAIALTASLTDRTAVGELVEGKVMGDVAVRGVVAVRNGAVVHGRVRRMERFAEYGGYFVVGLEFSEIDAAGAPVRFFADLQSTDSLRGLEMKLVTKDTGYQLSGGEASSHIPGWSAGLPSGQAEQSRSIESLSAADLPGVGSFFMRGARFEIPAGFRMIWKTRAM
jgi:hypothetical protein